MTWEVIVVYDGGSHWAATLGACKDAVSYARGELRRGHALSEVRVMLVDLTTGADRLAWQEVR